MFSFTTTRATDIVITIDGVQYSLPRFLMAEQAAWVAEREREIINTALERLPTKQEQARFLTVFQPPPVDVLDCLDYMRSPKGVQHVLRACMKRASVPVDIIEKVIAGDPMELVVLARQLSGVDEASAAVNTIAEVEDKAVDSDPLPEASSELNPTSCASPSTGDS